MKILDSDHCIALLRDTISLPQYEQLAITTISIGELFYGVQKSANVEKNLKSVNTLVRRLTILTYDEIAARIFGKVKAELERVGTRLDNADLQIACIVLRHNAVLVTHNQRHFQRIPGLVLEDWIEESLMR